MLADAAENAIVRWCGLSCRGMPTNHGLVVAVSVLADRGFSCGRQPWRHTPDKVSAILINEPAIPCTETPTVIRLPAR